LTVDCGSDHFWNRDIWFGDHRNRRSEHCPDGRAAVAGVGEGGTMTEKPDGKGQGYSNRLVIHSLLVCASACIFLLALMTGRQIKTYGRVFPVSDWAGEYLWVIAPLAALAIASAVTCSSPFFSRCVHACVVFATVANPALLFLIYILLGGNERDSMALFVCPVITWNVLGAFLVTSVIVRIVRSVRKRRPH
jgi:hypothetical protein